MMRLLAGLGLLVVCSAAYAEPRKSDVLYVVKFDAKGVAQDEASTIETSVCTAASQDGRFVKKCRDTTGHLLQLRQAQAELGFAEGAEGKDDCGKEGCMGALGAATDAKWVLGGSVAKVAEKQYLMTLVVVDPATNVQINHV